MTEKQLEKKILDGGRTLLFSNEDLKRLIIPLVIDQVLARTVGMADTMMISSVGEAAISGVSLVDMINMLINAVFAAVATGGAVIASQYLGHRDRKKACEASSQLMVVTAVCALLFTVLSLAARKPLLSLLFGQIDADVMDAALTYLTVSALSFPFLASFNSSSALFRAMNDSRTPTVVSLGMNVMNLIGNSILIFGMKWGVAGAAISTLLSRVMAAAVMFALSLNRERQLYVRPDQMTRFQPTLIGQILYIGIPSGIENGIFELGRIVVVSMISTFGTVQIAANAVANNLDGLGVLAGAAMNLDSDRRWALRRCARQRSGALLHAQAAQNRIRHDGCGERRAAGRAAADFEPVHALARVPRAGDAVDLHPRRLRHAALAAGALHAQRAARRQRREIHHGAFHRVDGLFPHCAELCRRCEDGLWRAGRVVRDAGGLGGSRGGLYVAL